MYYNYTFGKQTYTRMPSLYRARVDPERLPWLLMPRAKKEDGPTTSAICNDENKWLFMINQKYLSLLLKRSIRFPFRSFFHPTTYVSSSPPSSPFCFSSSHSSFSPLGFPEIKPPQLPHVLLIYQIKKKFFGKLVNIYKIIPIYCIQC